VFGSNGEQLLDVVVVNGVIEHFALAASPDKPVLTQDAQLMRDRRSIETGRRRDIEDAELPRAQRFQYAKPGWIANDGEDLRQLSNWLLGQPALRPRDRLGVNDDRFTDVRNFDCRGFTHVHHDAHIVRDRDRSRLWRRCGTEKVEETLSQVRENEEQQADTDDRSVDSEDQRARMLQKAEEPRDRNKSGDRRTEETNSERNELGARRI
jgi:hypothetical protein